VALETPEAQHDCNCGSSECPCDNQYLSGETHRAVQQVIRQTCLSPHFGMIGERLGAADESFGFIEASFTPPSSDCKAAFDALLPSGLARWLPWRGGWNRRGVFDNATAEGVTERTQNL